MKQKFLEDKIFHNTVLGILVSLFLIVFSILIFQEISFVIAGIAIMIIGTSLMYYVLHKK
jgi:hypothetical protein